MTKKRKRKRELLKLKSNPVNALEAARMTASRLELAAETAAQAAHNARLEVYRLEDEQLREEFDVQEDHSSGRGGSTSTEGQAKVD
jgi:hypothetical protein